MITTTAIATVLILNTTMVLVNTSILILGSNVLLKEMKKW
jgi:hypothetical protein